MSLHTHHHAMQTTPEIQSALPRLSSLSAVIGFDAFVDESLRIVHKRFTPESYEPVPTLGDYGAWVSASAGRSGLREFVSEAVVAGGCAVNMGDGLATLGLQLDACLGAGNPPHPVFQEMLSKCRSVLDTGIAPGRALVTEFQDGKLMLCGFSHFAGFTPRHIASHLDHGPLRSACAQAAGIALTTWSAFPYMTDCWKHLQSTTLRGLDNKPHLFFDLADPASRTREDLVSMAEALRGFVDIGRTALSLNGNEAAQLAEAIGIHVQDTSLEASPALAAALRRKLDIHEVCIHLIKGAATSSEDGDCSIEGPYTANPRRSVGAGDRFNAGFFAGLLLGLSPEARLRLGCAASGFFVRNARSATAQEVTHFLEQWSNGQLQDSSPC